MKHHVVQEMFCKGDIILCEMAYNAVYKGAFVAFHPCEWIIRYTDNMIMEKCVGCKGKVVLHDLMSKSWVLSMANDERIICLSNDGITVVDYIIPFNYFDEKEFVIC